MRIVTVDLETYWSTEHTLSKMNPIVYCTHPETEVISAAIKIGHEPTQVYVGDEIRPALAAVDWQHSICVGHNMSGFDAMILAWRYGVRPQMWGCTLAMSRPLHMKDVGGSLAKLVSHYNLGVKDQTVLHQTKGRHLKDFTPDEIEAMRTYNKADVDQTFALFKLLAIRTPAREMKLIDLTTRMLVYPKFITDIRALENALTVEVDRKQQSLRALQEEFGVTSEEEVRTVLASAPKFAEFLTSRGVEVPTKPSPSDPEKTIHALAKTDPGLQDLLGSDDPVVAAAVAARIDTRSTLLETRLGNFINVARATGGRVPVPLRYYGAGTGRWSGGGSDEGERDPVGGLNLQNLPRIDPKKYKPTDILRKSLKAPPGKVVVVADQSGIELRVNHFLWKVPSSMKLYQENPGKADLYKAFAAEMYHCAIEDVTKDQRQVAKIASLGLQFGAGHKTFQKIAKTMGGINITLEQSKDIVDAWRQTYPEITWGWKLCGAALRNIHERKHDVPIDPWGMCVTAEDGIKTPVGFLHYPNLRQEDGDYGKTWVYGDGRQKKYVPAPLITENLVQHLARNVFADNVLQVSSQYPIVHMVHDEVVTIAPEAEADESLAYIQGIMRTPPKWWKELIVWSEGSYGKTYGEAK